MYEISFNIRRTQNVSTVFKEFNFDVIRFILHAHRRCQQVQRITIMLFDLYTWYLSLNNIWKGQQTIQHVRLRSK